MIDPLSSFITTIKCADCTMEVEYIPSDLADHPMTIGEVIQLHRESTGHLHQTIEFREPEVLVPQWERQDKFLQKLRAKLPRRD